MLLSWLVCVCVYCLLKGFSLILFLSKFMYVCRVLLILETWNAHLCDTERERGSDAKTANDDDACRTAIVRIFDLPPPARSHTTLNLLMYAYIYYVLLFMHVFGFGNEVNYTCDDDALDDMRIWKVSKSEGLINKMDYIFHICVLLCVRSSML